MTYILYLCNLPSELLGKTFIQLPIQVGLFSIFFFTEKNFFTENSTHNVEIFFTENFFLQKIQYTM